MFVIVQGYERFALAAQDQHPVLVGLRLEDVVGFTLDLHDVVNDVAFLFAGLLIDQLDGLNLAVRFGNLWHSASWPPPALVIEVPLQQ